MDPERWRRLKDLLAEALARPEDGRASFLAEACAGEPALRSEVASLLAAHEGPCALDRAVAAPAAGDPDDAGEEAPDAESPRAIGPYQLLRAVGRGGMGVVYLAERTDGEFRRRVAVKLIRRGMDSEHVVSRFRNERQILAALAHPNIASLLDGGTTEDGQPYLVMEYIEGQPVDRSCDERRLSVSRRLELFLAICDAVHHAHRSLVVHRDLKPGNILVTSEGVPKLLDFGVAKILDASDASPELTAAQLRFVTPGFASPEQLRGGPITTASDVFSLGVLLYELLTGRRPFETASGASADVARATCELEPPRPSAAVTRAPVRAPAGPHATKEALSAVREGSPDRLRRRLAGDLDTILLKAMSKEPERRYASVERLADDVRRHLSGRPVSARSAGAAYRARKFAARHRAAVAIGVLLVASLAAGAVESSRQRARAERRFADVRHLANSFLFEFDEAIRDLPGATRARELVVKRAREYLDGLAQETGGDPSIQRELATAYQRLAEVQGSWGSGLGDVEGSISSLRAAVGILDRIHADAPGAASSAALGEACAALGLARATAGDGGGPDDARRGVRLAEDAFAADRTSRAVRSALARTHQLAGMSLAILDEDLAARPHFRRAADELERIVEDEPGNREAKRALAKNYYYLATFSGAPAHVRRAGREPGPAADMMRRAVALNEERLAETPGSTSVKVELSFSHVGLAAAYADLGLPDAAIEQYARALALREQVAAADPANAPARLYVAETHFVMGETLNDARRPGEAIVHLLEADAEVERLSRADAGNAYLRVLVAQVRGELGEAELGVARSSRPAEAAPHWRAARAWYGKSEGAYRALREEGKLSADRARDSEENVRRIGECDAALGSRRQGAATDFTSPR